jgi:pimeloyl-ACP methyl ester carboxylesterase
MELTSHHPFRSAEAKEQFLEFYSAWAEKWPVPSETRMVDTAYGQTFVRISGPAEGAPLALLHGAYGNSLMWLFNVEALSESFRTYAVDIMGDYGLSVDTRPIRKAEDYLSWLDSLLQALEPERKTNLVGLSLGGWLTSLCALHSPDRLEKAVLLAPVCTVLPLPLAWYLHMLPALLPLRSLSNRAMNWLFEDAVKEPGALREFVQEWQEDSSTAMRCFKPRPMVQATVLKDEQLQSIETPTLFLVGENEKIYDPHKAVQRLNDVAPQIETEIIPHAGHDLLFVQADTVNRRVLEFLL